VTARDDYRGDLAQFTAQSTNLVVENSIGYRHPDPSAAFVETHRTRLHARHAAESDARS
jgi:hypothetical protein